jgi:hypothetical protein
MKPAKMPIFENRIAEYVGVFEKRKQRQAGFAALQKLYEDPT